MLLGGEEMEIDGLIDGLSLERMILDDPSPYKLWQTTYTYVYLTRAT
jgi:hypothetical protein